MFSADLVAADGRLSSCTVYRETAAFDTNGAGVVVKTPDGKPSRLPCDEDRPVGDLFVLNTLGLRILPVESLVSTEGFGTWPADGPNTDLLEGVRTHDLALVAKALKNGADPNFHAAGDVGVLGALVDGRRQAITLDRVRDFDQRIRRVTAGLRTVSDAPGQPARPTPLPGAEFYRAPPHAAVQTIPAPNHAARRPATQC